MKYRCGGHNCRALTELCSDGAEPSLGERPPLAGPHLAVTRAPTLSDLWRMVPQSAVADCVE